ncbi:MAG: single-stranded DNA-binding protein [Clostridia bacterium]|nr:single-stranded DNA-binding protein [Clostridia bacterium]
MNKVFLIGNLTRDPEMTTTNSGIQMCRFGIAVNRNFANAEGVRETDFFNITAWRSNAERCGKYLHKGNKVAIQGNIQVRNYESNGEKRTSVDIIVDEIEFLTPRSSEGGSAPFEASEPAPAPVQDNSKVVELEPVEDTDLPF